MLVFSMVFFTACGNNAEENKAENPKDQQTQVQEDKQEDKADKSENKKSQEEAKLTDDNSVVLYIGYESAGFQEKRVPMTAEQIHSDNFDEYLLDAISKETGWQLDLAQPIEDLDGGKVISFSDKSAFVVGPPEPQKDEYHVYDNYELAQNILGTIQKTLDMNMSDGQGANSLDLYFEMNGKSIVVEDQMIPFDKPWNEVSDKIFS